MVFSYSLIPRPCAFVACSTKFAPLSEFRTASDERAGPENEANFLMYTTHIERFDALSELVCVCDVIQKNAMSGSSVQMGVSCFMG